MIAAMFLSSKINDIERNNQKNINKIMSNAILIWNVEDWRKKKSLTDEKKNSHIAQIRKKNRVINSDFRL